MSGSKPSSMVEVDVIEDTDRANTMLHPTRLELLEHLREPDSAAGLARRMGLPRQRINYHLRELEKHRLLELVEEKRTGNVVERIYRRTGHAYAISTEALGRIGSTPEAVQDRFSSAFQIALASRSVRELGQMQTAAAAAGKKLPTLALETEVCFRSPEERNAFANELTDAVAQLVSKYHDASAENGRTFRLTAGAYPKPKGQGGAAED